jgi:FkbM family methyltransferase
MGPDRSTRLRSLAWRIRLALGARVQALLHRLGYEIRLYQPGADLTPEERRRAKLLAARGVSLVLDVGANAGQYAGRLRAAGYDGRIVSFEPLSTAYRALSAAAAGDSRWETRKLALGEQDGSAEINVAANSWSSSLLDMGPRHLESAPESAYVGTETVETARLESLFRELARDGERVFLKLDVQGYEMYVLRGADPVLDRVDGVQAEMSIVPMYEGDSSWRELVDWLEERGFRLAGLEPGFEDPATGELLQADGIFVRRDAG